MVFAASDATTLSDVVVVVPAWTTRWSGGRCDDAYDDRVTRWDLI